MKPQGIFLLDAAAFTAVFGPLERSELERCVDLLMPPLTAASWQETVLPYQNVQMIFSGWGTPVMDTKFLGYFPSLLAVFHAAGTVKGFTTDALWNRGVRVTCAASMNAIPVAEFAFSQIIFCLKQGWQRVREVKIERRFRKEGEHLPGAFRSTVGLISLSRTGRLVAEHLRRLDVKVIAYDPFFPADQAAVLGVTLCGLEDVFAIADVISCHTPLLPDTTQFLRKHHFSRMRPGTSFINTARGSVVHEAEMIDVLAHRPDIFALLDVTDPEPPAQNSPLFSLPNVVITPHIAGSLGPECLRLGQMMVEEVKRYLNGQPLQGEVVRDHLSWMA